MISTVFATLLLLVALARAEFTVYEQCKDLKCFEAEGETCGRDVPGNPKYTGCDWGLSCPSNRSNNSTCTKVDIETYECRIDDYCYSIFMDQTLTGGLGCAAKTEGGPKHCFKRPMLGSPCDESPTELSRDCAQARSNLSCQSGKCAVDTSKIAAVGENCGDESGKICDDNLYCDYSDTKCKAKAADGEPCNYGSSCASGICVKDVCVAAGSLAKDAECDHEDEACASGLECGKVGDGDSTKCITAKFPECRGHSEATQAACGTFEKAKTPECRKARELSAECWVKKGSDDSCCLYEAIATGKFGDGPAVSGPSAASSIQSPFLMLFGSVVLSIMLF